jgi:hypothetical protein
MEPRLLKHNINPGPSRSGGFKRLVPTLVSTTYIRPTAERSWTFQSRRLKIMYMSSNTCSMEIKTKYGSSNKPDAV